MKYGLRYMVRWLNMNMWLNMDYIIDGLLLNIWLDDV